MRRAGRREERVTFWAETGVSDGGGGSDLTWSAQFSRWAAIVLPSVSAQAEVIGSGALRSTVSAQMTITEDSETKAIDASWRVVAMGRTWNVRQVFPGVDGFIRMSVEQGEAV